MKDFSVDDFAAIVGIDWADKKHDICELPAGTRDYQWSVISIFSFEIKSSYSSTVNQPFWPMSSPKASFRIVAYRSEEKLL